MAARQFAEPLASRMNDDSSTHEIGQKLAQKMRGRKISQAPGTEDYYIALADIIQEKLLPQWEATKIRQAKEAKEGTNASKHINYISQEWLIGPNTPTALHAAGLNGSARKALRKLGQNPDGILRYELDPGSGNGGLGRLAACFGDSAANLGLPFTGYGLYYEDGFFKQDIDHNGRQVVLPDKWEHNKKNPWGFERKVPYTVKIFGKKEKDDWEWKDAITLKAAAHDIMVPSYDGKTVNTLRLWKMDGPPQGNVNEYQAELISRINKSLYPDDKTDEGKKLRLMQEYFMTSLSLQDMIHRHLETNKSCANLAQTAAVQMNDTNDTHPTIAIPELMRLLMDEQHMGWDQAKQITKDVCFYTNHTVMPEAMEKWKTELFKEVLPRHYSIVEQLQTDIISDIEQKLRVEQKKENPIVWGMEEATSIIHKGMVHMARMAAYYGHRINGVSAMHSKILVDKIFPEVALLRGKDVFDNKTNGITPRRWVVSANPKLADLYTRATGSEDWITNLSSVNGALKTMLHDAGFRKEFADIKRDNKKKLIGLINEQYREENIARAAKGIEARPVPVLDADAVFDVQAKRIHEYKRQFMNILQTVALYQELKANPEKDGPPVVKIFAGKAAPGYEAANDYIGLMNRLADIINSDTSIRNKLKVVFIKDYNVSKAETIIPAADISEQISTAGTEASGTGNMKFALNGALTLGTRDGANVEIGEKMKNTNIFFFGKNQQQIEQLGKAYDVQSFIAKDERLKNALDFVSNMRPADADLSTPATPDEKNPFKHLIDNLLTKNHDGYIDQYKVIADFSDYCAKHEAATKLYKESPSTWLTQSIENSRAGAMFSSDDTIKQYAEMWNAPEPKKAVPPPAEKNWVAATRPQPSASISARLGGLI
jgi:starch phosphorylase